MTEPWYEYPNLVSQITDLRREANEVYQAVVKPQRETAAFAQTLYGYMHRVFGFIDALSSYWRGNAGSKGQSSRMVDFMEKYLGGERRAHAIAVQIWRHKVFHTALPRNLFDKTTGKTVHYLIQWGEMTPHQPHYSIVAHGPDEVFNLSCLSLIEDLETAALDLVKDIEGSPLLEANAASFASELSSYTFRTI